MKFFNESHNKVIKPFALVHCDVWGPYHTHSSCGAVYFLTIVDDYSREVWIHLMLEKSEVPTLLQNFCAMAKPQFDFSVKTFRTDNGTEFLKLKPYLRKEGITHQTSSVDTPQQNGRVERKHRHILNVARAYLFQANIPVTFWGQSILTAAHLINGTPSCLLGGKSPYELLHGSAPKYDTLRVAVSALPNDVLKIMTSFLLVVAGVYLLVTLMGKNLGMCTTLKIVSSLLVATLSSLKLLRRTVSGTYQSPKTKLYTITITG